MTSEKFLNKVKTKVAKMLKNVDAEEEEEEEKEHEEKDYVCYLMHKITHYHHEIDEEERSVKDIEKEIKEKVKGLTGSENRVLSVLLRSDGPYAMSQMLGMEPEEFLEHLRELSKKVYKHCSEEEEK